MPGEESASLQQTPVDLVHLASRVVDVAPDQAAFRFLDAFPVPVP